MTMPLVARSKHVEHTFFLLMEVDYTQIAGCRMTAVKRKLMDLFEVDYLVEASMFLGMAITRDRKAGLLPPSQQKSITNTLRRSGLEEARPSKATRATGLSLVTTEDALDTNIYPYSELVGVASQSPHLGYVSVLIDRERGGHQQAHCRDGC
jgi:hypothetical protein